MRCQGAAIEWARQAAGLREAPRLGTSLVDCLCQLMPAFTKATPPLATLLFQKSIYGCLHPQVYIPKAQRLFFSLSSIGWHFIVALA